MEPKRDMMQFLWLFPAASAFEKAGKKFFLVGGCVRDLLMGNQINDHDIATDATPEETIALVKAVGGKVIDKLGGNFGTVHCIIENKDVEITTFRKDIDYPFGDRRPVVEFSTDFFEDQMRRDFTCNCIGMDIRGELQGYFSAIGQNHINDRILKSPQNPDKLFQDDPLRILRMYRFSRRLGFEIEYSLRQAARNNAHLLKHISRERIHSEIVKIAGGHGPHHAFRQMMEDGVLTQIFPQLLYQIGFDQKNKHHHLPLWEHTLLAVMGGWIQNADYKTILALLLHDIAKPYSKQMKEDGSYSFKGHDLMGSSMVKNLLTELKFTTEEVETIEKMILNHVSYTHDNWDAKKARRFLNKMGNLTEQFIIMMRSDRIAHHPDYNSPECFERLAGLLETLDRTEVVKPTALLNGHEIMELLNITPGPTLGLITTNLKHLQVDGDITTKEEAIDWLKREYLKS